MSFKSVLSKIEEVVAVGAKEASAVYPFLAPLASLIPGKTGAAVQGLVGSYGGIVVRDAQVMADLSQQVQAMVAASKQVMPGSAKAAAIAPFFSTMFQDVEVLGGKKLGTIIKDADEWNGAMQDMAMAVGRALKSCGD